MPDCWLEIILHPEGRATAKYIKVFRGFPQSSNKLYVVTRIPRCTACFTCHPLKLYFQLFFLQQSVRILSTFRTNQLKTLADFSPALITKFTSHLFTFFIYLRSTLFQHTSRRWASVNCLGIFKTGKLSIPLKQSFLLLQPPQHTIFLLYLPSSGLKWLLLLLNLLFIKWLIRSS
jgi:hypothetical protein